MIAWIQNVLSQNFSAVISACAGLIGVCIGARLTQNQATAQRKLDFFEKQLRELYSPLVGCRKEVQILSEFRLAGEEASQEWWAKVCELGGSIGSYGEATKFYDDQGSQISTQIEYENKQLEGKIIPAYRKMVQILKDNYWLAEEETRNYFPTLVKFVEVWERYLSRTHPMDVIQKINVSEAELFPFYENIQQLHDLLREKLKKGEPD